MPTVIAIGASAGGPRALQDLLARLPQDIPAAFLLAVHRSSQLPNRLPEVLARRTRLRVMSATQGALVTEGIVYVCVPDFHLMLLDGEIRLTRGPKENHARPAIDVLFRSCAVALGAQAIGVLLSGVLDDGTAGLWSIKDAQGQAIVQQPDEAEFPGMPENAIRHVDVDHVARIADMPALFVKAIGESRRRTRSVHMSDKMRTEMQIAQGSNALISGSLNLGPPTELTCPDCGGVLAQIEEGRIVRFRCHTGHAYSGQSLLAQANERIDTHLWRALRAVDERCLLLERRAAASDLSQEAREEIRNALEENRKRGDVLRPLLTEQPRQTGM